MTLATAPFDGWYGFDADHAAYDLRSPTVGYICHLPPVVPSDLAVPVARTWTNAAARGYHEPCVPAPDAQPHFTAVPRFVDPLGATGSSRRRSKAEPT